MKCLIYFLTCDNCGTYHMDAETGSVVFDDLKFLEQQALSYGWRIEHTSCICHGCLQDTVTLIINKPAAVTAGL
jgi:hypothetical protein